MDRSFERNFGRGASSPQVEARKSSNSSKSCIQQISPSNANKSTTNFSIFNGPNYIGRNQDNGPQYLNDYKNRQFQQANQSLHEQQPQRSIFSPNTYQQLNELKNTSVFSEPTSSRKFAEKNTSMFPNSSSRNDQKSNLNSSFRNNTNQHNASNATTSSNTLGLLGIPKPVNSLKALNNTHSVIQTEDKEQSGYFSRIKKLGITEAEKMCILTGTAERVIKWGKIFQNHFCYFEVIAAVVSMAEGKVQYEQTMLLRDIRMGPVLQVTYYSNATHINIVDFYLGQILRVVGRMIGPNMMSALTIRAALPQEHETLPRMCAVSDHAVSMLCGNNVL